MTRMERDIREQAEKQEQMSASLTGSIGDRLQAQAAWFAANGIALGTEAAETILDACKPNGGEYLFIAADGARFSVRTPNNGRGWLSIKNITKLNREKKAAWDKAHPIKLKGMQTTPDGDWDENGNILPSVD